GRGVQAQSRLDRSRMNCDDCGGGGRRGNGRARGKGAGMPSWLTGGAGTLVLATLSAYAFLRLRCRRAGQPFGPRAKRWAVTIILLTAIVSTGLGLAAVAVGGHIRAAYIGLLLPSGLLIGQASVQGRRRGPALSLD